MRFTPSWINVFLVLGALLAGPAQAQERVALVIGNGAYVVAPKLTTPANDANDLAEALGKAGFDVTVATDLDRSNMQQRLQQFSAKLGKASVSLFYFSGLGLEIAGAPHLAGVDIKPTDDADITQYTVPLAAVLEAMAGRERKLIILVDASRENPLPARPSRGTTGASPVQMPSDTMIAFSTAPGAVVRDTQARNSPYAAALIKHLGVRGAPIETVVREVRNDVMAATDGRQIPWDSSSLPPGFTLVPAQ
jgi:uncharacterized caspase-like protein